MRGAQFVLSHFSPAPAMDGAGAGGAKEDFVKFPRTYHIFDTGALIAAGLLLAILRICCSSSFVALLPARSPRFPPH